MKPALISGRRLRGAAPFCPRLTAPIGKFFHQKSGGYWATYSRPRPPTRSGHNYALANGRSENDYERLGEPQSFFARSERYRSEMGHAHPTSKVLLPRLRKEQNAPRLLAGAGQDGSRRHPLEAARLALHLGANGRRPPSPAKEKPVANAKPQRRQEAAEYGGGSLTTGKLNAVRAAFKAGASVLEHDVAAMREVRIEMHPRQRSAQQAGQRLLAHLERLAPQVIAVKLQEIEGNEKDVLVVAAMP